MATLGLSADEQQAVDQFRTDVVTPSMTGLVIVDFWAEWCGPCKQLSPVLEKVAVDYADKGVTLVKIDVDANKFIASQFRVQSIPTVYAIHQGQPVADLTTARTEAQVKQMLDQILRQLPIESEATRAEAEIEPLLVMAQDVLASGDAERAVAIFAQIADLAPDHPGVRAGQARALIALGNLDGADAALALLPDAAAKDAGVLQARAALDLARAAPPPSELAGLAARVAADGGDHAARHDLAVAQIAAGDRDAAADNLLHIVATDRDWHDGAARNKLLALIEAVGLADPWGRAQRRRLSDILFG